jgi:CheY-like chemotaxis protein
VETVLIIEDDDDTREALVELLAIEGHPSITTTNGREALHELEAGLRPCLILLDLMLPVMSGWEFRRQQLLDPRWADIPIIIVSGANDLPAQAERLGATAFLAKPIALQPFYEIVSRYC